MADINVFCDASIDINTKRTCAGVLAVNHDGTASVLEQFIVQPQGTNNSGEVLAVLTGIKVCASIKAILGEKSFNIFSDSRITIEGLRNWVFGWIKTQQNGVLYNSSGQAVANQNYYKEIIRYVTDMELDVKFYNQKGHCTNSEKSISDAELYFRKANGVSSSQLGLDTHKLITYNNYVDNKSRLALDDSYHINYIIEDSKSLEYFIDEETVEKYRRLINLRIV